MTTPLEKIAEEKTGNYQSSEGGGGAPPHWQKTNNPPPPEGFPKESFSID